MFWICSKWNEKADIFAVAKISAGIVVYVYSFVIVRRNRTLQIRR